MGTKPGKIFRCAIYTRKSTEHGLELEFNSLDAQREACEAYIKSQASEGWRVVAKRYDDPAYSGGNIDRPAVQRLLKDIEAGLIDVVVVYKIDRLTRSLADFAKLVEVFDSKSVSFVAVTQQFNTTTSMGRLTLNVLLSFAQFERELASERVRDKIAASRKKGIWTGGGVPLGYDNTGKRLLVIPVEAKTVRMIFDRYLALKSFQKLIDELNDRRTVTKKRKAAGGSAGGVPFTYGSLSYLLKNRTYLGETGHDGSWFPGEHEPIIDREIFDNVQLLLKSNSAGRTGRRQETGALLTGLIFDDRGNRMSPSFSVKRGVRYPFYVSSALLRGRRSDAGSVTRVSASEAEAAILAAARQQMHPADDTSLTPRDLIEKYVARIVVKAQRLLISLNASGENALAPIEIAWSAQKKPELVKIEGDHVERLPLGLNPQLVQALVRAHAWRRLLTEGRYGSIESLARSVDLHPKVVRSRIRLAFLEPQVTRELLHGLQPTANTVNELVTSVDLGWRRTSPSH
jgi:site-specific DNA recombinase